MPFLHNQEFTRHVTQPDMSHNPTGHTTRYVVQPKNIPLFGCEISNIHDYVPSKATATATTTYYYTTNLPSNNH